MNRVKIPPGNLGVDTGGDLTDQRPRVVKQNSPFRIQTDMMMEAMCSSYPFGVDVAAHAQWMQMCSISSDNNLNDAMPQLVLDSTIQQPCMYTSSSDGTSRLSPSTTPFCLVFFQFRKIPLKSAREQQEKDGEHPRAQPTSDITAPFCLFFFPADTF